MTSPKSIHPPLDLDWESIGQTKAPEKLLEPAKFERDKLLDKLRQRDAYKIRKTVE